jgi:galactoside O-acetyltransferase
MNLIKRIKSILGYKLPPQEITYKAEDYRFQVHESARLYYKENIILAESSKIWENAILRAPLNKIKIGEQSHVGVNNVLLCGPHGIEIGNYVMLGPNVVIAEGNHEYRDLSKPMLLAGAVSAGKIIIEDDVWICANCTITDNVTIGKGAIIGANSVVTKNVPPYSIYAGVPAKKIGSRC